jgi:AraC-like DNA-binding protein
VASEAVFSRAQPVDQTPYRQHFRAPLRFDREHSAVRFPAHWQAHLIPGADAERRRALAALLEVADSGVQMVSQLHRALRLLLLAGKSSGDELAQTLSLHRRTLSRRLRAQGTTFQKVLDEVRFEVARQLLERTRTPIDRVAAALCYAAVLAGRGREGSHDAGPAGRRAGRRRADRAIREGRVALIVDPEGAALGLAEVEEGNTK